MAADFICANCGHLGDEKQVTKGSFGIEVILWLCFLIPGLIYSLWRLSSRYGIDKLTSPGEVKLATEPHAATASFQRLKAPARRSR